jgi:hypothetical protein
MAGPDREREEARKELEAHGWFLGRETKRGYWIMRCSCDLHHQETIHKTPSDPRHVRLKVARMIATCTTEVP